MWLPQFALFLVDFQKGSPSSGSDQTGKYSNDAQEQSRCMAHALQHSPRLDLDKLCDESVRIVPNVQCKLLTWNTSPTAFKSCLASPMTMLRALTTSFMFLWTLPRAVGFFPLARKTPYALPLDLELLAALNKIWFRCAFWGKLKVGETQSQIAQLWDEDVLIYQYVLLYPEFFFMQSFASFLRELW